MTQIGLGKKCSLTDLLVIKIIYYCDDDGFVNKENTSFIKLCGYDKVDKKKIDNYILNINKQNVTLPIKYNYPSDIKVMRIFKNNNVVNELLPILTALMKFVIPVDVMINDSYKRSPSKIIRITTKVYNEQNEYVFKITNEKLFKNSLIKKIIFNIYNKVVNYIKNKKDSNLLKLFLQLYPDPYQPKGCWIVDYQVIIQKYIIIILL